MKNLVAILVVVLFSSFAFGKGIEGGSNMDSLKLSIEKKLIGIDYSIKTGETLVDESSLDTLNLKIEKELETNREVIFYGRVNVNAETYCNECRLSASCEFLSVSELNDGLVEVRYPLNVDDRDLISQVVHHSHFSDEAQQVCMELK